MLSLLTKLSVTCGFYDTGTTISSYYRSLKVSLVFFNAKVKLFAVYGIDGVIIMDGSDMGNVEAAYLEQRLGLAHQLKFEFNDKKKFNCLASPLEYCLSDAKGRPSTIDKRAKLKHEIGILQGYFKPQMVALFDILYPQLSRHVFCERKDQRFQRLNPYICQSM